MRAKERKTIEKQLNTCFYNSYKFIQVILPLQEIYEIVLIWYIGMNWKCLRPKIVQNKLKKTDPQVLLYIIHKNY